MEPEEKGEDATRRLEAWVARHLPGVAVAPASLAAADDGEGVRLRLVGVAPRAEPRRHDRLTLKLRLDYLLTVRLADPRAEQDALVELAFAAMGGTDPELVADRAAAEFCRTLGLPPTAGLLLRTEAVRTEALPKAPPVREPVVRLRPLFKEA